MHTIDCSATTKRNPFGNSIIFPLALFSHTNTIYECMHIYNIHIIYVCM